MKRRDFFKNSFLAGLSAFVMPVGTGITSISATAIGNKELGFSFAGCFNIKVIMQNTYGSLSQKVCVTIEEQGGRLVEEAFRRISNRSPVPFSFCLSKSLPPVTGDFLFTSVAFDTECGLLAELVAVGEVHDIPKRGDFDKFTIWEKGAQISFEDRRFQTMTNDGLGLY